MILVSNIVLICGNLATYLVSIIVARVIQLIPLKTENTVVHTIKHTAEHDDEDGRALMHAVIRCQHNHAGTEPQRYLV